MAKEKILIIKLGAAGDVLRTTVILPELHGEITWVTRAENFPLLFRNPYISYLVTPQQIKNSQSRDKSFDLALSLDDDFEGCEIASLIETKQLIGAHLNGRSNRCYTDRSARWFDMGLISRFGLEKANELKKANKRTYQDFLFQMLGLEFTRQEYVFPFKNKRPKIPVRIGIESRAGDRWPTKKWPQYEQLYTRLSSLSVELTFFRQRPMLEAFINDVNNCDIIVTGDTLCMHLGLALKKRVIALFGPTSADEIFDYGRLSKIVSPAPCVKCYRRECSKEPNCMSMITLHRVLDCVKNHYENLLARVDEVPAATDLNG